MALQTHRPSALKQQNKKHRTLGHKTKGEISKHNKGRVSLKTLSKKVNKELSREQRRHQSKQIRSLKRDEAIFRKRALGTAKNPPFLVTIVPLGQDLNPRKVLSALQSCHNSLVVSQSCQGLTHISCPRLKQRFSFVVPPVNDLYAVLDSIKTSDTVLFIWPTQVEELEESSDKLLSAILSQGLPTPVHVTIGLQDLSSKKKVRVQQNLLKEIESRFSESSKIHTIDKPEDARLLLRHIGAQKQRPVFYRDNRPHLMAEKLEFKEQGPSGTLKVYGYVRGQPLSVNRLVHIPGWGEFQMSRIELVNDPYPLENCNSRGEKEMEEDEPRLLEEADDLLQESLISTNEINPMDGEQTWPTEEELDEADTKFAAKTKPKKVPKGTSDYQAAWILDESEESDKGDEDNEGKSDIEDDFVDPVEEIDAQSQDDGCKNNDEFETMTETDAGEEDNYDERINYDEEMDTYYTMKAARDDLEFPDEIDTPQNVAARVRFQKYRGLQSFRTSLWDPRENLPLDYSRIFQFKNFQHTRKRVLREEKAGALPGWYVILHIMEVPSHLYKSHVRSGSPFVLFAMFPHEQKMSVLNMVIKSHGQGHLEPIKSKDKLIFHMGFRRFAGAPIFSEHSTGNKHKFFRYFHPGSTVVATLFAPITFPPVSVTVFRERLGGSQDLVGIGSLMSSDPNRLVIKRVVLTGHPFKINKRTAVVRYMFFSREDIVWFKPVELRTKWGRRGHIKEPLGTHGHMKCYFDSQLKSQDTVLLHLYKRIYPKWTYDPHVPRPLTLYSLESIEFDKGEIICKESNEVHVPCIKKTKIVSFHLTR